MVADLSFQFIRIPVPDREVFDHPGEIIEDNDPGADAGQESFLVSVVAEVDVAEQTVPLGTVLGGQDDHHVLTVLVNFQRIFEGEILNIGLRLNGPFLFAEAPAELYEVLALLADMPQPEIKGFDDGLAIDQSNIGTVIHAEEVAQSAVQPAFKAVLDVQFAVQSAEFGGCHQTEKASLISVQAHDEQGKDQNQDYF